MENVYFYPPPLWNPNTLVNETYPERHFPLEDARHTLGHTIHDFFIDPDGATYTPRADIRETPQKYYIDVEFPGLGSAADLLIRWSNPRVIVISGNIRRNLIPEDKQLAAAPDTDDDANTQHLRKKDNLVHYLKRERHIGKSIRAFEFVAEVDHDSLMVKLQHGLLKISIDKKPHEEIKNKINIEAA